MVVILAKGNTDSITVDGDELTGWQEISDAGVKYVVHSFTPADSGVHTIENDQDDPAIFMAYVQGYGYHSSYGYPGVYGVARGIEDTYGGNINLFVEPGDINLLTGVLPGVASPLRIGVHNNGELEAHDVNVDVYRKYGADQLELLESRTIPFLNSEVGYAFFDMVYYMQQGDTAIRVEVSTSTAESSLEEDILDNSAEMALSAFGAKKADLIVEEDSLKVVGEEHPIGNELTLRAKIWNGIPKEEEKKRGQVSEAAAEDFYVRFTSDTALADSLYFYVPCLPIGESTIVEVPISFAQYGVHNLYVEADCYNSVVEVDESNNFDDLTYDVKAPDLYVSAPASLDLVAGVVKSFDVTARNKALAKDIEAGTVIDVALYVGDPGFGGREVDRASYSGGLAQGVFQALTLSWANPSKDVNALYVVIDPDNRIEEQDESFDDNSTTIDVTVHSALPDLEIYTDMFNVETGMWVDTASPVEEGTLLDISAYVYSAVQESSWVKVGFYNGDPSLPGSYRIGEEQLIGSIPREQSGESNFVTWDTTGDSGKNEIWAVVDEPGHLAGTFDGHSTTPAPLEMRNLLLDGGIRLTHLSAEVECDSWTLEVWSVAPDGLTPGVLLGSYHYDPTVSPHGNYEDGSKLREGFDDPSEVLLHIVSGTENLPDFDNDFEIHLTLATALYPDVLGDLEEPVDNDGEEDESPLRSVRIYLPDNSKHQYGNSLYLWLATDGSTYFADKYHLSGQYTTSIEQTAWESMNNGNRGVVAESNETNNFRVKTIEVLPPTEHSNFKAQLFVSAQEAEVGDVVTLTGIVTNSGADWSGPIPIQFTKDGEPLVGASTSVMASLKKGASIQIEAQWIPDEDAATAGSVNAAFVIDPASLIAESDEGDNEASTTVNVQDPLNVLTFTVEPVDEEGNPEPFILGDDGQVRIHYGLNLNSIENLSRSFTFDGDLFRILEDDSEEFICDLSEIGYIYAHFDGTSHFDDYRVSRLVQQAGDYRVRAYLYAFPDEGGGVLKTAQADYQVRGSLQPEIPVLFVSTCTDRSVYSITENGETYVRIENVLENRSSWTELTNVQASLTVKHDGVPVFTSDIQSFSSLKPGDIGLFTVRVPVADLSSYGLGSYEVVLEAFESNHSIDEMATTFFSLICPEGKGEVQIVATDDSQRQMFGTTSAKVLNKVTSDSDFSSTGWMTVSDRRLRSWYGGGKNMLFNPGLDYDSDGDGTANGWQTEADTALVTVDGGRTVQLLIGQPSVLSTDHAHRPCISGRSNYTLSFDCLLSGQMPGVFAFAEEFSDSGQSLRKLWYNNTGDIASDWMSMTATYCGEYERIEIPLVPTLPGASRMAIGILAVSEGSETHLLVDNVQLERGKVATSWEDSEPNNLVLNGGFEQWDASIDYTRWFQNLDCSLSGANGWYIDTSRTSVIPSSLDGGHSNAIKMDAVGTTLSTVLSQGLIEVAPNSTYKLSACLNYNGPGDFEVRVDQYDSSMNYIETKSEGIPNTLDGTWFRASFNISTTNDCCYLHIGIKVTNALGGYLLADNIQLERGASHTDWSGPVQYAETLDWMFSPTDGTKVADAMFMNQYGIVFRDISENLSEDSDGDGHFDVLGEGSSYEIRSVATGSLISGENPETMFDEDENTGFTAGEHFAVKANLGGYYLMDTIEAVVDDANISGFEIFYRPNGSSLWYPTTYDSLQIVDLPSGSKRVTVYGIGDIEDAPLKESILRVMFSGVTTEVNSLEFRGYAAASIDTAILDRTSPEFIFEAPTECVVGETDLVVDVIVLDMYPDTATIQGVQTQLEWVDVPYGACRAVLPVSIPETQWNSEVTLTAEAFDLLGHNGSATQDVYVDTQAPVPPAGPGDTECTNDVIHTIPIGATDNAPADCSCPMYYQLIGDLVEDMSITNTWEEITSSTIQIGFTPDDGSKDLNVYYKDCSDNSTKPDNPVIYKYILDTQAPDPIPGPGDVKCVNEKSQEIPLGATDSGSEACECVIEYLLEEMDITTGWMPITSAVAYYDLSNEDGLKDVLLFYRDCAGNSTQEEPSNPVLHSFFLDTVRPQPTPVDLLEVECTQSLQVPVNVAVEDPYPSSSAEQGYPLQYQLDVLLNDMTIITDWLPVTEAVNAHLIDDDGLQTVSIRYRDCANNISGTEAGEGGFVFLTDTIKLDRMPPENLQFITPLDQTVLHQNYATFTAKVACDDQGSEPGSLTVYIDNNIASWDGTYYAASVTITSDDYNEWYDLSATAEDCASGPISTSIQVAIDTMPPNPVTDFLDDTLFVNDYWNNCTVTAQVQAIDNFPGEIQYLLGGDITASNSWQPLPIDPNVPVELSPCDDGLKTISLNYKDAVGNELTEVIADSVTVDKTAPSVEITPVPTTPLEGLLQVTLGGHDEGVGIVTEPDSIDWALRYRYIEPLGYTSVWEDFSNLITHDYSIVGYPDGNGVFRDYSAMGIFNLSMRPEGQNVIEIKSRDLLDNENNSETSGKVSFVVADDKAPTGHLKIVAFTRNYENKDSIFVFWEPATELDISHYELQREAENAGQSGFVTIATLSGTDYEDIHDEQTNDINDYRQYYRVRPVDYTGNTGKWSNVTSAEIGTPSKPEPPLELYASAGEDVSGLYVDLVWQTDLNPQKVCYDVFRSTTWPCSDENFSRITTDVVQSNERTVSFRDRDVVGGQAYYYFVRAYYELRSVNVTDRSKVASARPAAGFNGTDRTVTIALEESKNNPDGLDWDYNDFVVECNAAVDIDGEFFDDIVLNSTVRTRTGIYEHTLYAKLEVCSGEATVAVTRDGGQPELFTVNTNVSTHDIPLIYANSANQIYDVGKTATLEIQSKTGDFSALRWLPWFQVNGASGWKVYPNVHGFCESNAARVSLDSSEGHEFRDDLNGWILDLVILLETEEEISFPADGQAVWELYPAFIDNVISGGYLSPNWYRTPQQ